MSPVYFPREQSSAVSTPPLPPYPCIRPHNMWGGTERGGVNSPSWADQQQQRLCSSSSSRLCSSSSTSSRGDPPPVPCTLWNYTGRVWLLATRQGLHWSSGQRVNTSPSPAGPPLMQQQPHLWRQLEEGGTAGSRIKNVLKNYVQGGRVGAAKQQPGSNSSPRGKDQQVTYSSISSSRRQPAVGA